MSLPDKFSRWSKRPAEQRAWVLERLAAVDPMRLNYWTDALDDAIAVLDAANEPKAKCKECGGTGTRLRILWGMFEPDTCPACVKPCSSTKEPTP